MFQESIVRNTGNAFILVGLLLGVAALLSLPDANQDTISMVAQPKVWNSVQLRGGVQLTPQTRFQHTTSAMKSPQANVAFHGKMLSPIREGPFNFARSVASQWSNLYGPDVKEVSVGRVPLVPPLAYHWAIRVGDNWFEVEGANKTQAPNVIRKGRGSKAESGVEQEVTVCDTTKEWSETQQFLENWKKGHPIYNIHGDNCQLFVKDFARFICGEDALEKLPLNDHRKIIMVFASAASSALSGSFFGCPLVALTAGLIVPSTLMYRHQKKNGYNTFFCQTLKDKLLFELMGALVQYSDQMIRESDDTLGIA